MFYRNEPVHIVVSVNSYWWMLTQLSHVFMCLCNTKLIHLSAFEPFWTSTVHKLLTKRKSSEYITYLPLCGEKKWDKWAEFLWSFIPFWSSGEVWRIEKEMEQHHLSVVWDPRWAGWETQVYLESLRIPNAAFHDHFPHSTSSVSVQSGTEWCWTWS